MSRSLTPRKIFSLRLWCFGFTLVLVLTCISILFAAKAYSAQATVAWNPSTDPVAGYKVYYGPSTGNYTSNVDAGNNTACTLQNLTNPTYFIAATAYYSNHNESAFSQEVVIYSLAASAGTGGSIMPNGAFYVAQGTSRTFNIAPSANYRVVDVQVDGRSVGAVSSYTLTGVAAPHTIAATFAVNASSYTITATAGANGSISPSGSVTVNSGISKTFTITPSANYKVSNVTVDGVSVGAVSTYTFSNVTANHTIAASFVLNTYTITATAGANGTISPSGSVSVNSGASKTFTITPSANYKVSAVTVDGVSVGAVSSYTFSNVTANHNISASFNSALNSALLELNFEEGSGSAALDSSGSGNHGTINGAVYTTNRAVGSYALSFGGNARVTVPAKTSLKPSNLSVAFWVKHVTDTTSSYGGIIQGAYGNGYSRGFRVIDYQNKPVCQINFGDAAPIWIPGNPFVQGQWIHIVLTYDHQKIRLYQNGGLVREISETRNINWDVNVSNLTIGLAQWYFKGMTDKIQMYNYALSSQEAGQLYAEKGAVTAEARQTVNASGSSSVNNDGESIGTSLTHPFSKKTSNHTISADFNEPPFADAGPDQIVAQEATVTLNGFNSRGANSEIVSYLWTQISGMPVVLPDPAATEPTFTAPCVGPEGDALTFELTVTDKSAIQATDTCIVNVTSVNMPPVGNAGSDQTVSEWTIVNLDGTKSTDSGDVISSYLWEQTAGPPVELSDQETAQPTFVAPEVGSGSTSMTFRLTVTGSSGLKATDSCIVNVTWANAPPQAIAGPSQTVNEGTTVTLDGSASSDPDDGTTSFRWHQTGGAPVTLSDPMAVKPTFIAPSQGADSNPLSFRLTVTDNGHLKARTTQVVTVK